MPVPSPHRLSLEELLQAAPPLGAAGQRVLAVLREHREAVLASSAAELGARAGTSDATVVRTVQALGFAGLAELKGAILASFAPAATPAEEMRRSLDTLAHSTSAALDEVLAIQAEALALLASPPARAQIAAAVQVLDPARRIAVFGLGPSAALAAYVATMLGRAGRDSLALTASGAGLADQLLGLREGDVVLSLAYRRVYREVGSVFSQAARLGLATVLITEASDTALAARADVVVAVPRGRPGRVALHGATLVALEAIILSLAAARPAATLAALERLAALRRAVERGS